MHPDAVTSAVLFLLLAFAGLRIWWDAGRISDANAGAAGAKRDAEAMRARIAELEALIEEQRICPGDCWGRRMESLSDNFSLSCQQAGEVLAASLRTQRRRDAEEDLTTKHTETTKGEQVTPDAPSLTYTIEDLDQALEGFFELLEETAGQPERSLPVITARFNYKHEHGNMDAAELPQYPCAGREVRIAWTPPGQTEPLTGTLSGLQRCGELSMLGEFTPQAPLPDWFRPAWEEYKRRQAAAATENPTPDEEAERAH